MKFLNFFLNINLLTLIPFLKFIFFFFFITQNRFHFASCNPLITIKTPGVHNFQIGSKSLIEILIPLSFQAFIFSNVDMGLNNAFYLDDSVVPVHYQNLYGIAFNGSSRLLIRYYSSTVNQNMAVFIIPAQNCQQHALYAMSKNIFKIKIITKKFDYNFHTCAFSPSFVSDINRIVTFGYENKLNANAQIFYGFIPETMQSKSTLPEERNYTNDYAKIIKELDDYNKIKKEFKNLPSKIKHNNKINTPKFNFFSKSKIIMENITDELQKDYQEEEYFKTKFQNRAILLKSVINHEDEKANAYTISQSPGFLTTLKIMSEARRLSIVNTTYYVAYHVDEPNVNARIIFYREFPKSKSRQRIDSSMREKHSDFLLYYDKYNSKFIYDNNWADKIDVSYSFDFWKMMKWLWVVLIVIFVVILLLIIGCLCGYIRSDRFCCFKRKNSDHEFADESEINMNSSRTRYGNGCGLFNESNIGDDHFETVCYSPNLDDDFAYANFIGKKSKKGEISLKKCDKNRNNESESYSYEYEYEFSEEGSESEYRKKQKIKKKVKNNRNSSSLAASPYEFDVRSRTDLNQVYVNDIENRNHRSSNDNSLGSIEESEEMPNPYGLPHLSPNLNDNEDENNNVCNPHYPLC